MSHSAPQNLVVVDDSAACNPDSSPLDYSKIIRLFLHPDTSSLYDRQVAQLRRVARHNASGYQMSDLPHMSSLLLLSYDRYLTLASSYDPLAVPFANALSDVIDLAAFFPRRTKANEELLPAGLADTEGLYKALNRMLSLDTTATTTGDNDASDPRPPSKVQVACSNALRSIASGYRPSLSLPSSSNPDRPTTIKVLGVPGGVVKNDQRPTKKDLAQAILAKSGVVVGAISALAQAEKLQSKAKEELEIRNKRTEARMSAAAAPDVDSDEEESNNNNNNNNNNTSGNNMTMGASDTFSPIGREGGGGTMSAPSVRSSVAVGLSSPRAFMMSLLRLLLQLSESAANSGSLMLEGGAALIVRIMTKHNDDRDEVLNTCVELLWNCLDHSARRLEQGEPPASRRALIQARRQSNAMFCLSTGEAIGALCDTFRDLLHRGFRNKDKELRNEVLILSSLIASNKRSHQHFLSTRFVHLMCVYATCAEVGYDESYASSPDPNIVDPHHFATVSGPDIELKRIIWGILSELAHTNAELLAVIVDSPLIETLLMYLDNDLDDSVNAAIGERPETLPEQQSSFPGGGGPDSDVELELDAFGDDDDGNESPHQMGGSGASNIISRIPRTQLRVLQQQAMSVLLNLAPRAPDKFRSLGGHVIVLKFLDWCGDVPANRDLVQGALMLLTSVVALPGLQEELGRLDAIRIMLGRFSDREAPDGLRADAVRIISRLCANNTENQELLRKAQGISPLVRELEEYTKLRRAICGKPKQSLTGAHGPAAAAPVKETGGGGAEGGGGGGGGGGSSSEAGGANHEEEEEEGTMMGGSAKEKVSPLIVGVVDCIWNAVVGNRRSEARLLQVEGQDAILDLLELCPTLMRHQLAGVLTDLSRNKGCIPYLTAWRSDRSMVSAVQLLMRLWEEETKRTKVERADGVILKSSKSALVRTNSAAMSSCSRATPLMVCTHSPSGVINPLEWLCGEHGFAACNHRAATRVAHRASPFWTRPPLRIDSVMSLAGHWTCGPLPSSWM